MLSPFGSLHLHHQRNSCVKDTEKLSFFLQFICLCIFSASSNFFFFGINIQLFYHLSFFFFFAILSLSQTQLTMVVFSVCLGGQSNTLFEKKNGVDFLLNKKKGKKIVQHFSIFLFRIIIKYKICFKKKNLSYKF